MSTSSHSQDSAREPFLKASHGEDWEEEPRVAKKGFFERINYAAIATHCTIALVYLLVITATTWSRTADGIHKPAKQSGAEIYRPGDDAIEYELVDFPLRDFWAGNPFVGEPRPEHDEAWDDLLDNMNVRFTNEEMEKMNLTSLKLKDDSGYVATFTAYHEIHCVHWIRKWMHKDHYWPYLEGDDLQERYLHIEHCLENLRLNAMCRGDRTVSTYEWFGAFPRPTVEQPHTCINWEKFDAWNEERRFDLFDLDLLEGRPPISPNEEEDVGVRLGSKPPPGGATAGHR